MPKTISKVRSATTYYSAPRGQACVITYNGQVFQSKEDLKSYLLTEKKFSPEVADKIVLRCISTHSNEVRAVTKLRALGYDHKTIRQFLTGKKIKS